MEFKSANTHEHGWIDARCDFCSTTYCCLVDARGSADTGFAFGILGILPTDDAMRGAATADLRDNQQRGAALWPCPSCGRYGQFRVDVVHERVTRVVGWGSLVVLVVGLFALSAWAVPAAPAWTLLLIIAAAWFASGLLGRLAATHVDPNRDLEANLQRAQLGLRRGVVKLAE